MHTKRDIEAALDWADSVERSAVMGGEFPIATLAAAYRDMVRVLNRVYEVTQGKDLLPNDLMMDIRDMVLRFPDRYMSRFGHEEAKDD